MMDHEKIEVAIPVEVARLLDPSGSSVDRRVLEALAIHLVRQVAISSGKAAELLGISKAECRYLLRQHGIPCFNLTEEGFPEDLRTAAAAEPHRPD